MKTSKSSGTFRPFEDLKALLRSKSLKLGPYSVEDKKARPKTGDRQHSVSKTADSKVVKLSYENEKKIFLEAMSGVKPIPREDRVEHNKNIKPPIGPDNDSEAETLMQLDNLIKYGKDFIVADTPEYIEGTGYNVNPEFAKRLHRGDFSIQAHIDLHGLCVEDARDAFEKFFKEIFLRRLLGNLDHHAHATQFLGHLRLIGVQLETLPQVFLGSHCIAFFQIIIA